jgi:uncharacterized membrane protein
MIGTFIRLGAFFVRKKEFYPTVLTVSWGLLSLGIFFGIVAIFTGDLAHTIVHEKLCDHKVLDYHQRFAFTTISLFALALLLDHMKKWSPIFGILSIPLYIIAPIFLICTGYFGGKLVFEQGAGVESKCIPKVTYNSRF